MEKHSFCRSRGADGFTGLVNFACDALTGTEKPGLERVADPKLEMLVEGGKWKGVWSQNYFGMFNCTPVLDGRLLAYHERSLAVFFELQGDGRRADPCGFVAPRGALPEYVSLADGIFPKYKNDESSGLAGEFDFWVEGSAASVLMYADLLLSLRDREKAIRALPGIECTLDWLLSRRDKNTGLLRVGPAGTLIERAYGATRRTDGTAEYGLPAGTAVNTVAALLKAAELEQFAGRGEAAERYRDAAGNLRSALKQLIEKEEFFINFLDADGIRHGVPGAGKHAYFECNPNIDAAAWSVADAALSGKILDKISSKEISPYGLAACVWPRHDDSHPSYQRNDPAYGGDGSHWNGAAWFSSQARLVYAYLKNSRFDAAFTIGERMRDIYRSGTMRDMMYGYGRDPAGSFNPEAQGAFYVDGFAVFGALLRGLFEVEYTAEALVLRPHLPPETENYVQQMPFRWGRYRIFPEPHGTGTRAVSVKVNGVSCSGCRCDDGAAVLSGEFAENELKVEIQTEP